MEDIQGVEACQTKTVQNRSVRLSERIGIAVIVPINCRYFSDRWNRNRKPWVKAGAPENLHPEMDDSLAFMGFLLG
jgi:hypothetical protein